MESSFSSLQRDERIESLQAESFDVLVIGGGITGAGIALDAASRGMRTALIEMQDFAAGTSSRSTKLIHGGLRYLRQYEIKMVAEVGRERAVVYENGPHVTTPERMLLPIFKMGTLSRFSTATGLMVYDVLAGVKREERRRMLSRKETIEKEPLLKKTGLLGAGYYVEYRTDDARLTIEVLKKAAEQGAIAVNYALAEQLVYEDGKAAGIVARDLIGERTFTVRARKIVNATGPWADTIREMDRSKQGKTLRLTKGVHLVFDGERFPLRQAVYFDHSDGRMLFAIPRGGKTYVGTTDTDFKGNPQFPIVTEADRNYVLQAANHMFPELQLKARDVESSWAGLRPLIGQAGISPSEVSRKDEMFRSPTGLLTIAGGKLTGYRKMAETVTDLLHKELTEEGRGPFSPCATKTMPISGGDVGGSANFPSFVEEMTRTGVQMGISAETAEMLTRRYGTNVSDVYALYSDAAEAAARHGLPPEVYAMLHYGITREMAVAPSDFFVRRTGALFFQIDWVKRWRAGVIQAMAELLRYSEGQLQGYEQELNRLLEDAAEPNEEDAFTFHI